MGTTQNKKIDFSFKVIVLSLMIITGAINTLSCKLQNAQLVYEGPYYKHFYHPFIQTTTMFIGELLALFVFCIFKFRNREEYNRQLLQAKEKGKQLRMNKFLLAIPALTDVTMTVLNYIALNFVSGSIYQMLRGGSVATTLLFSIFLLKIKVTRYQIGGTVLTLIGIAVVGISHYFFEKKSHNKLQIEQQLIGYLLLIISLVFNGFFFTFEQRLLNRYYIHPLEVVGYEGLFGLGMCVIVVGIVCFIPCGFGISACVFSDEGYPYFEQPRQYFREVFQNGALVVYCFIGIISISIFNIFGVTITKNINALARSIADVTRTSLIWGVGIIITVLANEPNYKWQLVSAGAILFELLGFVFLVMGNLVNNEIIQFGCLGRKRIEGEGEMEEVIISSTEGSMIEGESVHQQ